MRSRAVELEIERQECSENIKEHSGDDIQMSDIVAER